MKRKKPKIQVKPKVRRKSPMEKMLETLGGGTDRQPMHPVTITDGDGRVLFHAEKCLISEVHDRVVGTRHWSVTPQDHG